MTVDRRQIVSQCPVRDSHQQSQNKNGGLLDWQQAFVFCPWKDCKPPPYWVSRLVYGRKIRAQSQERYQAWSQ